MTAKQMLEKIREAMVCLQQAGLPEDLEQMGQNATPEEFARLERDLVCLAFWASSALELIATSANRFRAEHTLLANLTQEMSAKAWQDWKALGGIKLPKN